MSTKTKGKKMKRKRKASTSDDDYESDASFALAQGYFDVTCGVDRMFRGKLYREKFGSGGKGRSIFIKSGQIISQSGDQVLHVDVDQFVTPAHFEKLGGMATSKCYIKSIRFCKRPIKDLINFGFLQPPHDPCCKCVVCSDGRWHQQVQIDSNEKAKEIIEENGSAVTDGPKRKVTKHLRPVVAMEKEPVSSLAESIIFGPVTAPPVLHGKNGQFGDEPTNMIIIPQKGQHMAQHAVPIRREDATVTTDSPPDDPSPPFPIPNRSVLPPSTMPTFKPNSESSGLQFVVSREQHGHAPREESLKIVTSQTDHASPPVQGILQVNSRDQQDHTPSVPIVQEMTSPVHRDPTSQMSPDDSLPFLMDEEKIKTTAGDFSKNKPCLFEVNCGPSTEQPRHVMPVPVLTNQRPEGLLVRQQKLGQPEIANPTVVVSRKSSKANQQHKQGLAAPSHATGNPGDELMTDVGMISNNSVSLAMELIEVKDEEMDFSSERMSNSASISSGTNVSLPSQFTSIGSSIFKNDLNQCIICHSDAKGMLPCLHFICDNCSHSLTGEIRCPKCGESFRIEDVKEFLLPDQSHLAPCDSCEELKSVGQLDKSDLAIAHCTECKENLCHDCIDAHKRTKLTRNHHIISLLPEHLEASSNKCQIHPANTLDIFCTTCKVAVCTDCFLSAQHIGHFNEKIQDRICQIQQKSSDIVVRLNDAIDDLQEQSITSIEGMENSKERVLCETNDYCNRLIEMITLRKAEISQQIEADFLNKRAQLEAQFQPMIERFSQCKRFGQHLSEYKGICSEASLHESLHNYFSQLQNRTNSQIAFDHQQLSQTERWRFSLNKHNSDLEEILNEMTCIFEDVQSTSSSTNQHRAQSEPVTNHQALPFVIRPCISAKVGARPPTV